MSSSLTSVFAFETFCFVEAISFCWRLIDCRRLVLCMYTKPASGCALGVHTPIGIPIGPGPAPIWTRSTHTLDLVQALLAGIVQRLTRKSPKTVLLIANRATNYAQIGQNRVTHCTLPHSSGASFRFKWRRLPTPMAQTSLPDGAGLALKRHEGSSHYTFWPIIVDCDDPRIAPLRIFAPKRVT